MNPLRAVNLVLVGTLAGVLLTHVLEWPGKTQLSGSQWVAVQNHLYGGYAVFGAVAEIGVLILSLVLAALLFRRRSGGAALALIAAAGMVATLLVFAFGNQPINLQVSRIARGANLPSDWRALRDRWTVYHGISCAAALVAFVSLLLEAMGGPRRAPAARVRAGRS